MSSPLRHLALATGAGLALLALGAGPALADPCNPTLQGSEDSAALAVDGAVDDIGEDAYDSSGSLSVEVAGAAERYRPLDANGCIYELEGQQVAYPEREIGGLAVSRKVFVPRSGPGIVRWLNILRNPTGATVVATVRHELSLGTDEDTTIVATSSGDGLLTPGDAWAVFDERDHEDAKIAAFFDAVSPRKRDALDAFEGGPADGVDDGAARYDAVAIGPGETFAYMHVDRVVNGPAAGGALGVQRRAVALAFAQARPLDQAAFYAGLTAAERASLRNWPAEIDDGVAPPAADDAAPAGGGDAPRDAGNVPLPDSGGSTGSVTIRMDRSAPICRFTSLPRRITRRSARRGLRVRIACSEPAEVIVTLGSARAATRTTTGVARPTASVTLRPRVAALHRGRRLTVRAVARDVAGNRTTIERRLRVR